MIQIDLKGLINSEKEIKIPLGIILFLSFTIFSFPIFSQSITKTFTSSSTWTAPCGVTSITVEAWGAGGGGGGSFNTTGYIGGGGGGGAYSKRTNVAVVPGNTYSITIGSGGTAGTTSANGGNGGPTSASFEGISIIAAGGTGGLSSISSIVGTGGAGGTELASSGTTIYTGGNGANGASSNGGGGGSGAGSTGVGNNGSGTTAGAAKSNSGGAGGAGGVGNSNGSNASTTNYGGGGGGSGSKNNSGGSGRQGYFVLSFTGNDYCIPDFPSGVYSIERVRFNTLDNSSNAIVAGSSPDHEFICAGTTVAKSETYTLTVNYRGASGNTFYGNVFIDWNQDGDFLDSGEEYQLGTYTTSLNELSTNILIPSGASTGTTTMRVFNRFSSYATSCITTGYGQSEDYLITVCADLPGTASASPTALVCGDPTSLSLSGQSVGSTIQWQSSTNNSTWADVNGATSNPFQVYPTASIYYRAKVNGPNCLVYSNSQLVSITPTAGTASPRMTKICYNTSQILTLSGSAGSIQWEESANGVSGWINISGATNSTTAACTTATLTSIKYYRAKVTGVGCDPVYSDVLTIEVGADGDYIWKGGTTSTETAWSTAGNWCGSVPTASTDVIIPAGTQHAITIGGSTAAVCKSLTINSGATLTVSSTGTPSLAISGDLVNNGTINHSNSTSAVAGTAQYWIVMKKGGAANISGTGNFSNVALRLQTASTSVTLLNNINLKSIYLENTATINLSLSSYELGISHYFENTTNGKLNLNTGILEYSGAAANFLPTAAGFLCNTGLVYFRIPDSNYGLAGLTYYNLKIATFNTLSTGIHGSTNNPTISNNLELVEGSPGGIFHICKGITIGGNLTINSGSEFYLYGTAGTGTFGEALTLTGDLTIESGVLRSYDAESTVNVSGNWVNNGTFTKTTETVHFKGAANKTISGSSTTSFYNLTVNKHTDTTYCIEAISPMNMTGNLTLTNGVLKLTHASSIAQFTSSKTSVSSAGIWINGGTLNSSSYAQDFRGLFRISSGTATFGDFLQVFGSSTPPTALFDVRGGTTSISGSLWLANPLVSKISGGLIKVATSAYNSATDPTFRCGGSGSLELTGGLIELQNPNTGIGGDFYITTGAGIKSITGGTVQIGNQSTPASSIFKLDANISLYNLTINAHNNPIARITNNNLALSNNLTLSGGILDAATNSKDLTVGGNWINNSSSTSNSFVGFDPGNRTVTFNGNSTISGISTTTFHNLTITGTLNGKNSDNLNVKNNWINTSGSFNHNNGTVSFTGTGAQAITTGGTNSNKRFFNVIVNNSAATPNDATDVDSDAISVENNLTISDGQFQPADLSIFKNVIISSDGLYKSDPSVLNSVAGNWSNSGIFTHNTSTILLNGDDIQTVTGISTTTFSGLSVSNTGSGINLDRDINVVTLLTLNSGIVSTGSNKIYIDNTSGSSLTAGVGNNLFVNSFINGNLRRKLTSNTETYYFPLGTSSISRLARLDNNNLSGGGFTYLDSKFLTSFTNTGNLDPLKAFDGLNVYNHISSEGIWQIDADNTPATGTYDLALYLNGFSNLQDNKFGLLKRPSGSNSASDWETGGGTINIADGLGRLLSNGYALRKGLSSFSHFGNAPVNAPLPISLISFTAKTIEKTVALNWATSSEINNDYFTLEKTLNGRDFEHVAIINGAGNSNQLLKYSVIDYKPFYGNSFYRLKQTDYDEKFAYSDLVAVNIKDKGGNLEFEAYPNPLKEGESLYLKIASEENSEILIVVQDVLGKEYYSKAFLSEEKESIVVIDPIQNLSAGIYMVIGTSKNALFSKKVIVK